MRRSLALRPELPISSLAELPGTAGRAFEVGGPETLTYKEMLTTFGAVTGKRRYIIPLPVLTPRLSSYWLGLVTAVPPAIVPPAHRWPAP